MDKASKSGKVKAGGGDGGGGGAGRIRVGSTGKVSALMMQEIESTLNTSSKKRGIRIQNAPVSISCGSASTRRLRRMKVVNDGDSTTTNDRPQIKPTKKKTTHEIPMLDSEDLWMDKTPIRGKEQKKMTQRIVETVDLKCGKSDGDWSIIPMSNQLRRLSFSKISD